MLDNLTTNDAFNIFYFLILLALIGRGVMTRFSHQPSKFLNHAIVWLSIIFVLVVGYSYRYEFSGLGGRFLGEMSPSRHQMEDDGSVSFRVAQDGHYHIKTQVNDVSVEFMLDTGASDVVIPLSLAKRIGINIKELEFTRVYNTANGKVKGAPITLETIKIGDMEVHNVRASVNDSDLITPLLGMSFLEKLQGYEVRNGVLKLWW
jgi:aspartyl protease family protein